MTIKDRKEAKTALMAALQRGQAILTDAPITDAPEGVERTAGNDYRTALEIIGNSIMRALNAADKD